MPESDGSSAADDEPETGEGVPDGGVAVDDTRTAADGASATASPLDRLVGGLPRPGIVVRLARREARLTVRRGWALGLTVLLAVFAVLLATFSGSSVAPTGYDPVIASYVELATYLVPLAALAFGHGAIVGAAERGRLGVLLTLPVSRAETALGILVGRAAVLASAVVLGFGVPGLLLLREFGLAGWPTFAGFLLATVAVAVALLGIGVAISALASTSTFALAGALLVWVWTALVHDLLALGVLSAFEGAGDLVAAMIVSNPVATYRLLALAPTDAASAGLAAALDGSGLSAGLLVVALAAWVALAGVVSAVALRRKRV
ncbi:Cu-processing system permease protein [Halorubrum aquaticum]|uniref:Cu-processing system permease protein n=1 Tax=Halorubrum aquaticum TaxID=387340 RepID=A0A1I3AZ18_9EURY|nr:ABC transporter permease [Halorubrum aquaticum]SFH55036.1 Cu-processing system permease protein [Halorubrum aquaticum]